MPEPSLYPSDHQPPNDEALEEALERVRQEARLRAQANGRPAAAPGPQAIAAATEPGPSSQTRARPTLLFSLAVAIIAALGFVGIQTIQATTPAIEGFRNAEEANHEAAPEVTSDRTSSISAALMRTRGWVLPGQVATVDPALEEIRRQEFPDLAPEIALVPSLELDVDPAQELAALTAAAETAQADLPLPLPPPPPPVFGASGNFPRNDFGFNSQFGNQPDRLNGNPLAINSGLDLPPVFHRNTDDPSSASPANHTNSLPGDANGSTPVPLNTPAVDTDQAAPSAPLTRPLASRTRPTEVPRKVATLEQLQEQACSRLGFFARISCKDDIRQRYCTNRWNQHPDCSRFEREQNF